MSIRCYEPYYDTEDYEITRFLEMVESKNPENKYEHRKTMSIYKVPSHMQVHDPDAYKPKLFPFGPVFQYDLAYGQSNDQSYKDSAVFIFIKRAKKGVSVFVNALKSVIEQVTSSYDMGARSMFSANACSMMLIDGCFMLEVIRAATVSIPEEYSENDPVFSNHGFVHMLPIIRRDMMILGNQIPLVVLERLAATESGKSDEVDYINKLVMKFYNLTSSTEPTSLFLHVLDAYRKRLFRDPAKKSDVKFYPPSSAIICPVSDHYRAGLNDFIRPSSADHNLNDISFRHECLYLPMLTIDNNTEVYFRNLIAFEKLHHGAGGDAASYISFMSSIIHSAQDVAILNYNGIICNVSGSYEAVASMFHKLSKEVDISAQSHLNEVRIRLGKHFKNYQRHYIKALLP